MKVFDEEKALGIGELVEKSSVIACLSQVIPMVGDFKPTEQILAKYNEYTAATEESVDLYPMTGILVSTGWNKNDEVFIASEVWLARNTPVNKPFNYEHMGTDIIGHITGTYTVDKQLQVIPENTKIEDLPEDYHIVNNSVLYKYWRDPDHLNRAVRLIEEIEAGEWFLSMEAFVPHFDYGLLDSQGNFTIIERNASTAGISKHLRVYGGAGVYKNCKVGRVLRNIVFAGKGLVKRPANENSVIFNKETILASMENKMADSVENKSTEDVLNKTIEQLKAEVAEKDKCIDELKKEVESVNKNCKDTKAQLDEAVKETESVKAELAKVSAEKKLSERTNAFEKIGAGEESAKLAETFANLDDNQFKVVVEAHVAKYAKTEPETNKEKTNDAETVLANAQEKPDITLGTKDDLTSKQPAIAQSVASFIVKSGYFKTLGKGNK